MKRRFQVNIRQPILLLLLASLSLVASVTISAYRLSESPTIAQQIQQHIQDVKTPEAYVYAGLPQSPVNAEAKDGIQPIKTTLPNLVRELNQPWQLKGTQVEVVNDGVLVERDKATGEWRSVPMGNAKGADFLYLPKSGGPTPKDNEESKGWQNDRAREAARFGEANTYYHADRTLTYANRLLAELGEEPLPHLRIVVNAHACSRIPGYKEQDCDRRNGEKSRSFGGGHYRLPTRKFDDEGFEHSVDEINPTGEIHLGTGNSYIEDAKGDRVKIKDYPYNENPSHNAGIIIHEVGHHIVGHTADFRENGDRKPTEYSNRKIHMDEGTCDYWTAVMLNTPDIYEWHDAGVQLADQSNRDLSGFRTTADFVKDGDPHENGNVWSSALWDLRQRMNDHHQTDLLVMKALVIMGQVEPQNFTYDREIRNRKIDQKDEFREGLATLLRADQQLYQGTYQNVILTTFAQRGIDLTTPDRDYVN